MKNLDNEFNEFLAEERLRGVPKFIFWMTVILAAGVGVLLFSYHIPHLIFK